jgi:hypothetical protein
MIRYVVSDESSPLGVYRTFRAATTALKRYIRLREFHIVAWHRWKRERKEWFYDWLKAPMENYLTANSREVYRSLYVTQPSPGGPLIPFEFSIRAVKVVK